MDILETEGLCLEPVIGITKTISSVIQIKREMDK